MRGSRVAILGVSYKAGVGDLRESPALKIMTPARGARAPSSATTTTTCPSCPSSACASQPLEDVLDGCDVAVIVTAHPELDLELRDRARAARGGLPWRDGQGRRPQRRAPLAQSGDGRGVRALRGVRAAARTGWRPPASCSGPALPGWPAYELSTRVGETQARPAVGTPRQRPGAPRRGRARRDRSPPRPRRVHAVRAGARGGAGASAPRLGGGRGGTLARAGELSRRGAGGRRGRLGGPGRQGRRQELAAGPARARRAGDRRGRRGGGGSRLRRDGRTAPDRPARRRRGAPRHGPRARAGGAARALADEPEPRPGSAAAARIRRASAGPRTRRSRRCGRGSAWRAC